ncbi:Serine carboxypeptidase-like 17 [Linum grandiflorum]
MGKLNYLCSVRLLLLLPLLVQSFRSSASSSDQLPGYGSTAIKYLPGFHGPLPFYFETGYIGVGEAEESQLFYYFVKSERNAEEDPLLLWLTGGPGCSSISGLFFEIGPLQFEPLEYNGSLPTLILRPQTSWTQVSSIIFLETPAGTGFSYSTNPDVRQSDTLQASHVNEFLRKWLMTHSEFMSNPLYIAGDSYSGITIPAIVHQLVTGIEEEISPMINLKGYMIGNPVTGYEFEKNARIPFAYRMGLISDEFYKSLDESCDGEYYIVSATNLECLNNLKAFSEGTIEGWRRCNIGRFGYESDIPNSFKYHAYLSTKGYRSLIYRYIGVGEAEESQLFYYFVKSERNAEQDPLLLWLTGGPGCSSLSGLFFEIGPLQFEQLEYNGSLPTLILRPQTSWTQSLEESCGGEYHIVSPTNLECLNNLKALSEFISGLNNQSIADPACGYVNPLAVASKRKFLQEDSSISLDIIHPLLNSSFCTVKSADYGFLLCTYWANDERVRNALHVRERTVEEWRRCNIGRIGYEYDIPNSFKYHAYLSTKGYRSLIYSGDHDYVVPFLGTQAWIRALNYSIVDDWRSWHVEDQVGGYTRTYSNGMTFATVKGGMHVTPQNRPLESYTMFRRWINYESL